MNLGLNLSLKQRGAADFSPLALSNLYAWYRSDLGITLNGSKVSSWADQSGNGRHLIQNTAAQQPTYNATDSQYNNKPSLQFAAGSSTFMQVANLVFSTFTVYMVCRMTSDSYFWIHLSGSVGDYFYTSTSPALFVRRSTPTSQVASKGLSGSLISAVPKSFRMEFEGTYSSLGIYRNNSAIATTDGVTQSPGTDNGPTAAFKIFGDGSSDFASGTVAEIIICTPNSSAAEKAKVEAYLTSRYTIV